MLIVFVVLIAVLWWALSQVLMVLNVGEPFSTLAVVAFVVIAVFTIVDYFSSGSWFWRR